MKLIRHITLAAVLMAALAFVPTLAQNRVVYVRIRRLFHRLHRLLHRYTGSR